MPDADLGTAHGTIDITSASIGRAIGSLNTLSKAMLGVGIAAGVGLAYAVNKAADFEQEMARFESIGPATEKQMQSIAKAAKDLGVQSGLGATEVLGAFTELRYAGATTKDIVDGLGAATIHLAQAGEIPAADAARTLVNTMKQFGIEGSHAEDVANAIARAANASTIDINDLNTSLRYVGATAAQMGFSLEETTMAIALLGNEGIRGSTAGTTLRGVLVGLQANSGPAKEALHALGLDTNEVGNNFFTAEGKLRSFSEISEILKGALGGLGPLLFDVNGKLKSQKEIDDLLTDSTIALTDRQKLYAFSVLFGRRAMTGAFALAKEGTQGFTDLGNSTQYATTAQDIMNKRLDTLKGSWSKFKATLENLAITLGYMFLPALRWVTDALKDVVKWFDNLDPDVQKAIGWFIAAAFALLGFGAAAFKIGSWVLRLYRAIRDLGTAIKTLRTIMGTLNAISGGLITTIIEAVAPFLLIALAIAAVIAGFTALWIWFEDIKKFLEENPWAAAIAAIVFPFIAMAFLIVGALRWLYDHAEEIWAEIESIFNDVVDWLTGAWDDIEQAFNDAVDFITGAWDDIEQAFEDAKTWISNAIDDVVTFFKELPGKILNAIENLAKRIGRGFEKIGEGILKVIEGIPKFVQDLPTNLGKGLEAVIQFLSTKGVEMMMGLLNGLVAGALAVLNWFIMLPFKIWNIVIGAGTWLITTGIQILAGLVSGLIQGIQAVWNFFTGTLIPGIINFGLNALTWLLQAGRDIIVGLFNGLVEAVPAIWNWITGELIPGIIDFFGDAISWLLQAGRDVITGLWNGAIAVFEEVDAWFRGFAGNIVDAVGSLIETLLQAGIDVITGLWNGAKNIALQVIGWMSELPGKIVTAIGELGKKLLSAGEDLLQGLWNGMKNVGERILNWAKNFVSDLVDQFGEWLGLGSPSKYTIQYGKWVMEGLQIGLEKGIDPVLDTLKMIDLSGQFGSYPVVGAGGGNGYGPVQLVVNVNGNVSNPAALGREVGVATGRAYMQVVRSRGRQ